jgi:hypothetical protein
MTFRMTLAASAAAIAAFTGAGAHATTLYALPGATAEMPTDMSVPVTFDAAGGAASLSFIIDGYASLDGQNSYEDDFSLSLNSVEILKGTFNLGGGGPDVVYLEPVGASWANDSGNLTNITWAGGQAMITTPLALQHGSNTLTFSYTSLAGPGYAGFQGTGDEGWGLENVQVTGEALAAGVPEPTSWALMLVGFGGLGAMLRRQRRVQPVAATA